MKKLTFILLTLVSLVYSQGFHAYLFEYGEVDTITQYMKVDTTIQMDDVFVEMTEEGLVIYTEKLQQYHFFSTKEMFVTDTIFICTSMVMDQDNDYGMLTYCYNRNTSRRTVLIRYNNMYLKYWIRS
jgi:predicted small integral membrane protein